MSVGVGIGISLGCDKPRSAAPRRPQPATTVASTASTTNPSDPEILKHYNKTWMSILARDNELPIIAMYDYGEMLSIRPTFVAYASGRMLYNDNLFDQKAEASRVYAVRADPEVIQKLAKDLADALEKSGYNRIWLSRMHYTREFSVIHGGEAFGLSAPPSWGGWKPTRGSMHDDVILNWEVLAGIIVATFDREDLSSKASVAEDPHLFSFMRVNLSETTRGIEPDRRW